MSKILIVGAGDVGCRIARALAELGHQVWALRRSIQAPECSAVGGSLTWLSADVTRPETLQLPSGLEIVISALAPSNSGLDAYEHVYVGGARALQQALQGQSLVHQFWLSSTGVYGESAGEWIDADTPAQPARESASCLLQAEQIIQVAPWPSTIVRLGGLYGPGRERLLRWIRDAQPVQVSPPSWTNRLHVADASGLLVHMAQCALRGEALAPLILGVDSAPTPQHEVMAWLAEQMQMPMPPAKPAGGSQGKRVSNASLLSSGYVLRYPSFREGYASLLPQKL